MEISQGNPLYLKQAKMSWLSFYILFFFFHKIGEKRVERSCGGEILVPVEGDGVGKGDRRLNTVQKNVHMFM
jgi:hypothetical protein